MEQVSSNRKKIDWVFLLGMIVIAGGLSYAYPDRARGLLNLLEKKIAPCKSPITYSIGTVDPRFSISNKILIDNLKDAENIWESVSALSSPSSADPSSSASMGSTSNSNLFQYQEKGGEVTINFVYDGRQDSTNKLVALGIKTDNTKESYQALKQRYDALRTQVDSQKAEYTRKAAAYKQAESSYNAEIAKWNAQGGAPRGTYENLQTEKSDLAAQFANLKSIEKDMNTNVDTLNALATRINQLIVQLNINVEQYNREGASAGEFEEGVYQLSGGIQTINIYEYVDHISLVRVLSHEMGHALGLDHVDDSRAIMYKTNSGKGLEATEADIEELSSVCRW
ncbi:MAG: matrixin family metalloprotease [Candidatus Pacebacteria bacterium]|nr:matrixin family metalloprotease [Candidatus Paceibacterota bacterium]